MDGAAQRLQVELRPLSGTDSYVRSFVESMEIPRYFKLSTVAQMLGGVSPRFIQEEARRGRFYPPGVAGAVDTSAVVEVAGNVMISLAGVLWYLRSRCAWAHSESAAAFLASEMSGSEPVAVLEQPIAARNEGEFKRRLANG